MDPIATLRLILLAGDRAELLEHVDNLLTWLEHGGHLNASDLIDAYEETVAFDVVAALYWSLADYHRGQGSDEYRALSRLGAFYKPGLLERSPATGGHPVMATEDYYARFAEVFQDAEHAALLTRRTADHAERAQRVVDAIAHAAGVRGLHEDVALERARNAAQAILYGESILETVDSVFRAHLTSAGRVDLAQSLETALRGVL